MRRNSPPWRGGAPPSALCSKNSSLESSIAYWAFFSFSGWLCTASLAALNLEPLKAFYDKWIDKWNPYV